jgi:hypothetical protein
LKELDNGAKHFLKFLIAQGSDLGEDLREGGREGRRESEMEEREKGFATLVSFIE